MAVYHPYDLRSLIQLTVFDSLCNHWILSYMWFLGLTVVSSFLDATKFGSDLWFFICFCQKVEGAFVRDTWLTWSVKSLSDSLAVAFCGEHNITWFLCWIPYALCCGYPSGFFFRSLVVRFLYQDAQWRVWILPLLCEIFLCWSKIKIYISDRGD